MYFLSIWQFEKVWQFTFKKSQWVFLALVSSTIHELTRYKWKNLYLNVKLLHSPLPYSELKLENPTFNLTCDLILVTVKIKTHGHLLLSVLSFRSVVGHFATFVFHQSSFPNISLHLVNPNHQLYVWPHCGHLINLAMWSVPNYYIHCIFLTFDIIAVIEKKLVVWSVFIFVVSCYLYICNTYIYTSIFFSCGQLLYLWLWSVSWLLSLLIRYLMHWPLIVHSR